MNHKLVLQRSVNYLKDVCDRLGKTLDNVGGAAEVSRSYAEQATNSRDHNFLRQEQQHGAADKDAPT